MIGVGVVLMANQATVPLLTTELVDGAGERSAVSAPNLKGRLTGACSRRR